MIEADKKGDQTAYRILEAAASCIATIGIEKSSITAIAKRAKVSRSLVAYHFPKKEELFFQVIQYILKRGHSTIENGVGDSSGEAEIAHQVSSNFDFFLNHEHYFKCFSLFYYVATIDPKVRAFLNAVNEHAVLRIQGSVAKYVREQGAEIPDTEILRRAAAIQGELALQVQKYYVSNHGLTPDAFRLAATQSVLQSLTIWIHWFKTKSPSN